MQGFNLSEKEVMLGVEGEQDSKKKINLYLLVGKLVVSKFKYGEYPNILILYEAEKRLRKLV